MMESQPWLNGRQDEESDGKGPAGGQNMNDGNRPAATDEEGPMRTGTPNDQGGGTGDAVDGGSGDDDDGDSGDAEGGVDTGGGSSDDGDGDDDDEDRATITFNENNFINGTLSGFDRIFDVSGSSTSFRWSLEDSIDLRYVRWLGTSSRDSDDSEDSDDDDDDRRRMSRNRRQSSSSDYQQLAAYDYRDSSSNETLFFNVSDSGVRLNLSAFGEDEFSDFRVNKMIIELEWSDSDRQAFTKSGIFTVAEREDDALSFTRWGMDLGRASSEERNGGTDNQSAAPDVSSGPSGGNGDSGGEDSGGDDSNGDSGGNNNSADDDDGGGGGGGGLSTGAMAGIGVGAGIVAIALIGGLVWFLMRRRRRNKNRGDYNTTPAGKTFMGDKDNTHHTVESPRSGYSEDGTRAQQVPLSNMGGGVGGDGPSHDGHLGGRGDERDFAPYHDAPADGGAEGAGRQEQQANQGVSRSVAHLVEDGMTPDEIRRLEEEERQLDDAIERHGRR